MDAIDRGGALVTPAPVLMSRMLPCQHAAWRRIIEALRDRRVPVQLLVLGDSLLAGHGGYAKVFTDSLAELGLRVDLVNVARGGTSTETLLSALPAVLDQYQVDEVPTLILMDHSVNDACRLTDPGGNRLRAALESEMRWLLAAHPSVALLRIESYFSNAAQGVPNRIRDAYEPILRRCGVAHPCLRAHAS